MTTFVRTILLVNLCLAASVVNSEVIDQRDNLTGIEYSCYVQDDGWQSKKDGEICGTTDQSKQLGLLKISLDQGSYNCNLQYQVHVQDIGWMDWVSSGQLTGSQDTSPLDSVENTITSKRIEAVKINLAACPDVNLYYRVYVQDIGWMDWVKNNELAGTTGQSLRVEAIQIKVENPPVKYDYNDRIYSFFDGEYLNLPLAEILPDDPWVTSHYLARDIQTRMRLIPPWTFELESDVPYVIEGLIPFFSEKPFLNYQTNVRGIKGEFTIPNIVINTSDSFQIYDAVLHQSPINPQHFNLVNLTKLKVPLNVDSFDNCTKTSINRQGPYEIFSTYILYSFLTGQEIETIPGYKIMSCCAKHTSYSLNNLAHYLATGEIYIHRGLDGKPDIDGSYCKACATCLSPNLTASKQ